MPAISTGQLPSDALLQSYAQDGSYTDCYHMDLPGAVAIDAYIVAFYTSSLFKIERRILALLARKPASDADAKALALGQTARFSAWSVEQRADNQLLLRDFLGRTRSWLMVEPTGHVDALSTRLYFGSAVVPKSTSASGERSFGFAFHALSGFHRLYTRALMRSAQSKLTASEPGTSRPV